ncbi:hypothetical protein K457DRAFT_23355 [Linnemannia elongata AG-77]|uniref:Uncharacterized protein n=1 Tax=Linnemannia elongata AG-77 TaxID=1314771 RepID=A0A197JJ83_9FUNG|nr:hypothetical protein K457DRAFT_23355 [Linnemannia elongata AG-77]
MAQVMAKLIVLAQVGLELARKVNAIDGTNLRITSRATFRSIASPPPSHSTSIDATGSSPCLDMNDWTASRSMEELLSHELYLLAILLRTFCLISSAISCASF